jgi:hypothetical protein
MTNKELVLLTVFVETGQRRWFVAGIKQSGELVPLMCSEPGNLDPYLEVEFDNQVSFLRHRLCGVLQRGCDRLWGQQLKPRQIVFIADADFEPANPDLTQRVAEHFVEWMTNPPVVFFTCVDDISNGAELTLIKIAGELDHADRTALETGLLRLIEATQESSLWELATTKPTSLSPKD